MDGEEKTYGGCEGPDAMYVQLISSDGHEFIVKREHALTSGTIKAMLSGPRQFSMCVFISCLTCYLSTSGCSAHQL
uniref:SKP1 component POZ domain-containing protein n=1 Tax=Varanus komodoensis TaxID=61221 RepID=A0A8D2LPA8_VARKO